jgi:hypothetical protein
MPVEDRDLVSFLHNVFRYQLLIIVILPWKTGDVFDPSPSQ